MSFHLRLSVAVRIGVRFVFVDESSDGLPALFGTITRIESTPRITFTIIPADAAVATLPIAATELYTVAEIATPNALPSEQSIV